MAQGKDENTAGRSEKGGKRGGATKILVLSLAGLLMVGAAVGVTLYFTGALSIPADAEAAVAGEASETPKADEPPIYITFDPPFTVGFDDPTPARFLQIRMDVVTRDADIEQAIKYHMPAVRNGLVLLFSGQNYEDLANREGKENLRMQALEEIRAVLQRQIGEPGVEEVYFTSFVMQ